ncbi:SRPBCC domain-containing protein [Alkalihalobacillus berkeleyi]|uniref:SRPBCC domain-containing protein n=2 Tax=Pseudalkalibacillus berkeleyi TaxID=1069813 RepID=A0ABS9GY25_9BACL|nr:SRPBCC domain-containing protein [Pseudalkalibacillus berkeleyi]MCF6136503.1 SRPBCC domain-containing protein [Pseudalkalibacillus berkeleyi]
MSKATKSIRTQVEGRDLIMERIFDAPRELVFKAYSEADHLARWWGPQGWETTIQRFDFTPGGEWRYCMKCVDKNQEDFFGHESCGLAVYQEITSPEKIVYTDSFTDQEGNKLDGMPEMLISMEFVDHEGKTKLVTRTQFATEEVLKQIMDMGVVEGTSSQFEKLDAHLKQIQS